MTTADDVSELKTILENAEKATRKLSKRGPHLIGQIIARGDADSLGALNQMELQALTASVGSKTLLDIIALHKRLTADAQSLGIDVGAPPTGDDDIVIYSSGR